MSSCTPVRVADHIKFSRGSFLTASDRASLASKMSRGSVKSTDPIVEVTMSIGMHDMFWDSRYSANDWAILRNMFPEIRANIRVLSTYRPDLRLIGFTIQLGDSEH